MGGLIDELNNLVYEHGKYCGAEPYTESRKLRKFKDSLEGTTKYSTIMDLATIEKWNLQNLQGLDLCFGGGGFSRNSCTRVH